MFINIAMQCQKFNLHVSRECQRIASLRVQQNASLRAPHSGTQRSSRQKNFTQSAGEDVFSLAANLLCAAYRNIAGNGVRATLREIAGRTVCCTIGLVMNNVPYGRIG
jgi:hypothetical protein